MNAPQRNSVMCADALLPPVASGAPTQSPFVGGFWLQVSDGDARARALYLRHYSARHYRDGRKRTLFVGPGEKMVLLTFQTDALFVWRKFISDGNQTGVNCAIFRNESPILSSVLIEEAMMWGWRRWPGERFYTYIAANKIRSVNPGYCFKKAGWRVCGQAKHGQVILEALPLPLPEADGGDGRAEQLALWEHAIDD